jgi:type IV pilus assembly protein PilO
MATKNLPSQQDVPSRFETAVSQFRGLNRNDPGQWPKLPKAASYVGVVLAVLAIGWLVLLTGAMDTLSAAREREPQLKADYRAKLLQAVNLDELRKQKQQVQEYVNQLEKQLPGKAEMDALLSDINQAGIGRGLQFELFKPGQIEIKEYYAELPIAIKVVGRYHDMGTFASDVANLSRIVTLHNLSIAPMASSRDARDVVSTGVLAMEATARTYRYLDAAEVIEQRKAAEKEKAARK